MAIILLSRPVVIIAIVVRILVSVAEPHKTFLYPHLIGLRRSSALSNG